MWCCLFFNFAQFGNFFFNFGLGTVRSEVKEVICHGRTNCVTHSASVTLDCTTKTRAKASKRYTTKEREFVNPFKFAGTEDQLGPETSVTTYTGALFLMQRCSFLEELFS